MGGAFGHGLNVHGLPAFAANAFLQHLVRLGQLRQERRGASQHCCSHQNLGGAQASVMNRGTGYVSTGSIQSLGGGGRVMTGFLGGLAAAEAPGMVAALPATRPAADGASLPSRASTCSSSRLTGAVAAALLWRLPLPLLVVVVGAATGRLGGGCSAIVGRSLAPRGGSLAPP